MKESKFSSFLSFGEAAAIWDLDDSTLRHAVAAGRLKVDEDCRKYGKQWVVKISAMCRLYGSMKYQRWMEKNCETPARPRQPQQLEGQMTMQLDEGSNET